MIELIIEKYGSKIELNGARLLLSANKYENAIQVPGATYPECVGFIEYTKIRMKRLRGHSRYTVHATQGTNDLTVFITRL